MMSRKTSAVSVAPAAGYKFQIEWNGSDVKRIQDVAPRRPDVSRQTNLINLISIVPDLVIGRCSDPVRPA